MRKIFIIILLVLAALALGCVGNKQEGASTKIPVPPPQTTQVSPAETTQVTSPVTTPAPTIGEDLFGTEEDVAAIDAMLGDADLDASLSFAI